MASTLTEPMGVAPGAEPALPAPGGSVEADRRLGAMAAGGRPAVLFMLHDQGGGTVRYAKTVARLLGDDVSVLYGIGEAERSLIIATDPDRRQDGVAFTLPDQLPAVGAFARAAGLVRVNVFHALGFEARLAELLAFLGLPFDVTLTDFHFAAVHPHLRGEAGPYVGEEESRWLALRRPRPAFIDRAEHRVAISRRLARSLAVFWPDLVIIGAAPVDPPSPPPRRDGLAGADSLRVLMVDARSREKGRLALLAVSRRAARRETPIRFHVVGRGLRLPERENLVGHDEPAATVIADVAPHLAWFPFQLPETYSFALSDALAAGLPILASALGAAPERLHGRERSWLLPYDTQPAAWFAFLRKLIRNDLDVPPICPDVGDLPPATPFYPTLYRGLFRDD